jgi:hypothetical protein
MMPPFFSRPLRDDPLAWILAVTAICVVLWALSTFGQTVSLEISGHSAGQGLQSLSFSGEQLNVSILQNGSGWNMTLGGMA